MNSVYFSEEEVKRGLHHQLIDLLIKKSFGEQGEIAYYSDIRIKPEDFGAIGVEWEDVDWNHEWCCGHWAWIDDEHEVMKEVRFPDNHFEYLRDCDEEEALQDWLNENPGWEKDEYDMWRQTSDCVED